MDFGLSFLPRPTEDRVKCGGGVILSLRETYIWLESTRKYIPISRMSPNHVQSRRSPGLIFMLRRSYEASRTRSVGLSVCLSVGRSVGWLVFKTKPGA